MTSKARMNIPSIGTHSRNQQQVEHSESSVSSSNGEASQWQDRLLDSRASNSIFSHRTVRVHQEDFSSINRATFLKEAVQQVPIHLALCLSLTRVWHRQLQSKRRGPLSAFLHPCPGVQAPSTPMRTAPSRPRPMPCGPVRCIHHDGAHMARYPLAM